MIKTLKDLREYWEKGALKSLTFPQNDMILFVIAEFNDKQYVLLRYSNFGKYWAGGQVCYRGGFAGCVKSLSAMMTDWANEEGYQSCLTEEDYSGAQAQSAKEEGW